MQMLIYEITFLRNVILFKYIYQFTNMCDESNSLSKLFSGFKVDPFVIIATRYYHTVSDGNM